MQHDEFIGQVQNRAHLSSRDNAELATCATLEMLAERLALGESFNALPNCQEALQNICDINMQDLENASL
ncbi:DUF2267 domain-containing protein [Nostoc sp.]|uniref:DUF2267 domain-containing protein n=1 Tax=Nostoc sp. TaxID=1180 RepID=UPI002FFC2C52